MVDETSLPMYTYRELRFIYSALIIQARVNDRKNRSGSRVNVPTFRYPLRLLRLSRYVCGNIVDARASPDSG